MRTIVLLAALAVASAAWGQEQKKEAAQAREEAKPAAQAEQAPATQPDKPKPAVKFTQRRFQDARHCLEKDSNTEIIKCAEAYL